jgi:hypothetical protein
MMIDWYPAQRHMLHFVPGLRVKIDGQTWRACGKRKSAARHETRARYVRYATNSGA